MSAYADHILTSFHASQAPQSALARVLDTVSEWRRRYRGRRELAAISARDLHDMGITRTDADHELSKPFWRG